LIPGILEIPLKRQWFDPDKMGGTKSFVEARLWLWKAGLHSFDHEKARLLRAEAGL
jgi:hypothetical protein